MATTHPPGTFAARLRGSGLLSEDQLTPALAAAGDGEAALGAYLLREGLLTRFQLRQLRAGSTSLSVGPYVVVDCVGRGANGVVLKARHRLMPDRFVVLKTLDTRSLHRDDEAVGRFRREIAILSRLDHPNVVRALDVIQTRTQLYLVLEYVAGRDLGEVVRERGPLPVAEAVEYVVQAGQGLAYAHARGVVHRDVKPTNLLLTAQGVVKLSDLGLARSFTAGPDSQLTMKGLAIGTPEFMAPEQAEDASSAGPRSDLFSLGATLFHLLTATLPVQGSSYLHKLTQLLTLPPKPLREARPDAPEGLAAVCDRLRARRPEERPASADELLALLEPYRATPARPARIRVTPGQLADLVLQVLRGQADRSGVCARHGLTPAELDAHLETFLAAGRAALDPEAHRPTPEQVRQLHAKIGAQAMEIESLREQLRGRG